MTPYKSIYSLNEHYTYDINNPNKRNVVQYKGAFRCTNFTLNAFGMCSNEMLYNAIDIKKILEKSGYVCVDFYHINDRINNARYDKNKNVWYNIDNKTKMLYYPNYDNMTVMKFCNTNKIGEFIISLSGHAVAYVNGVLWDSEGKGFSKKRMLPTMNYQVFSDTEYNNLPNLLDQPFDVIQNFIMNKCGNKNLFDMNKFYVTYSSYNKYKRPL